MAAGLPNTRRRRGTFHSGSYVVGCKPNGFTNTTHGLREIGVESVPSVFTANSPFQGHSAKVAKSLKGNSTAREAASNPPRPRPWKLKHSEKKEGSATAVVAGRAVGRCNDRSGRSVRMAQLDRCNGQQFKMPHWHPSDHACVWQKQPSQASKY